ncbi:hypothetical protein LY76DRAFT_617679 [Colletotrichum caudatum]|nr:hypothetical protein LY76DRAFT_617679 [Colletotrichum caudatum]
MKLAVMQFNVGLLVFFAETSGVGRLGELMPPYDIGDSISDLLSHFGHGVPRPCSGPWCKQRETKIEGKPDACISGRGRTAKSGNLCEFSCSFGFCLESLCECTARGTQRPVPKENEIHVVAKDDADRDLNHLCQFSCKYGNCPKDVCTIRALAQPDYPIDYRERMREDNARKCLIFKNPKHWEAQRQRCEKVCSKELEQAKKEGRTTSAICVGFWPVDKPIPWDKLKEGGEIVASGTCHCDNQLLFVWVKDSLRSLLH